ncbi:hypothetical protein [Brevibacillus sp. BC25]|uniref:hypothetical protein n=1 Tax=Brevibacillus sp. BC25 TaxID=1144308 RepID=UPI00027129CA|nr:hypothetical protein [Brevibacillus sp. BC25]EJL20607.1 hypothetical protein PMI05_05844 [Brevibacillus sp. BC25]
MGAKIEIFVDGSHSSPAFVEKVKALCCPKCEVIVLNKLEQSVEGEFEEKTKAYGIEALPAVTMDGKVVDMVKVNAVKKEHERQIFKDADTL